MLVYGDNHRREATSSKVESLRRNLALARMESHVERHARVVAILIEAGELAQGVLDDVRDDPRVHDALAAFLLACGRAVVTSWRSAFDFCALPHDDALHAIESMQLPETIRVTSPEGYHLDAVYPELYVEAARDLPDADLAVVGIRSIGTSLGAAVAAARETDRFVMVRPEGHPFDRKLRPMPQLDFVVSSASHFAVVDEGPGLSGSSFVAVSDALADAGVSRDAITFLPGHANGPGVKANEHAREVWNSTRQLVATFDEVFLARGALRDLFGGDLEFIDDLSAGAWRKRMFGPDESRWPGSNLRQERRKFLVSNGDRDWLLRFAGLGNSAHDKLRIATDLGDEGMSPAASGVVHGFILQEWLGEAVPLPLASFNRSRLAGEVTEYLAHRAERFATSQRGASGADLLRMIKHNAGILLGTESARQLEIRCRHGVDELDDTIRPALTDNRMHAWEWIVTPDGRLLKTDATDHHAARDLIGCQDLAWDIVGAEVELGLDADALASSLGDRLGRWWSARVLDFCRFAYLTFQAGSFSMAREALAGTTEESRLAREVERYVAKMRERLASQVPRRGAGR